MKIHAEAELLIRASPSEVFTSFVDPKRLTQFWLNHASAPLKKGARVEWEFMVPGARDTIKVTRFERNKRLTIQWSDKSTTDFRFERKARGVTHVVVKTSAFGGKRAGALAVDNTQGYTLVLCDLKTLLETGKSGGMVRDKAALIIERLG